MSNLKHADVSSWFDTIWTALHGYREDCIPEGEKSYDEEWEEICTAMAWLAEQFEEESK